MDLECHICPLWETRYTLYMVLKPDFASHLSNNYQIQQDAVPLSGEKKKDTAGICTL